MESIFNGTKLEGNIDWFLKIRHGYAIFLNKELSTKTE